MLILGTEYTVLELIHKNPSIKQKELATETGKSLSTILNKFLPESYDREIFLRKSTLIFEHIVDQAMTGYNWVA